MKGEKGDWKMGSVEIGLEGSGERRVPERLGEAVLYGKYWSESGLVDRLRSRVRVERGRMGQYEVMDYVLRSLSATNRA